MSPSTRAPSPAPPTTPPPHRNGESREYAIQPLNTNVRLAPPLLTFLIIQNHEIQNNYSMNIYVL